MEDYEKIIEIIKFKDLSLNDQKKIIEYFKNNINNTMIINKIIHLKDQFLYLKIIHLIENYLDVSQIEEERIKYINKLINDGQLRDVSVRELMEYVIYYFVRDNYYNFLVNFNQMVLYMKHKNKMIISTNHINFYKDCLKLNELSKDDIISFFKKNMDKDKMFEHFYDDMRTIKNDSYNDLVSKSLNLGSVSLLCDLSLSKKYGLSVYYLNGESFHAFVRCIIPNKDGISKDALYCNLTKKYYSFSYIGDKNIGTIDKVNSYGITVMYSNIISDNIVHVHHTDSSSSQYCKNDVFISRNINEISSADSLISNTKYYNEIVIKKGDQGIVPTAIVCFDKIQDKDLVVSFKYNLPIVLINSKKYYYDNGYPDYSDNDTYIL